MVKKWVKCGENWVLSVYRQRSMGNQNAFIKTLSQL